MSIGMDWDKALTNLLKSIRRKIRVVVKEGKDEHFKAAIRSFDEHVQIQNRASYYLVTTNVDENEIKNFTSVKSVQECRDEESD